jgi:hypothetical protein
MNKYYPLRALKKVLKYTVLYFLPVLRDGLASVLLLVLHFPHWALRKQLLFGPRLPLQALSWQTAYTPHQPIPTLPSLPLAPARCSTTGLCPHQQQEPQVPFAASFSFQAQVKSQC